MVGISCVQLQSALREMCVGMVLCVRLAMVYYQYREIPFWQTYRLLMRTDIQGNKTANPF